MSDITMLDRTRIINSMENMVDRIEIDKLVARLSAENADLKHDIEAYRGALGYAVVDKPGVSNLTDGTTPQCGMCNSQWTRGLEAENAELKALVKELDNECEAQQYQFDILKQDPACVWANMLRGTIARPTCLVEAHDYQQIKSRVKILAEENERIIDLNSACSSHNKELSERVHRLEEALSASFGDVVSEKFAQIRQQALETGGEK